MTREGRPVTERFLDLLDDPVRCSRRRPVAFHPPMEEAGAPTVPTPRDDDHPRHDGITMRESAVLGSEAGVG